MRVNQFSPVQSSPVQSSPVQSSSVQSPDLTWSESLKHTLLSVCEEILLSLQYFCFVNQHELQWTFKYLPLFSFVLFPVHQPGPSSLIVYLSVSSSSLRPSFSRYCWWRKYLIMTFCNPSKSERVWRKIILKIPTMMLFLNFKLKNDPIFNISFLFVLILSLWKASAFIKSFIWLNWRWAQKTISIVLWIVFYRFKLIVQYTLFFIYIDGQVIWSISIINSLVRNCIIRFRKIQR